MTVQSLATANGKINEQNYFMNLLLKLFGMDDLSERLAAVDSSLKNAAAGRPIPVQTFPVNDDIRFEKEKQQTALVAAKQFLTAGKEFIDKLNDAHRPVDDKLKKFFALIDQHVENGTKKNADAEGGEVAVKENDGDKGAALNQAMKELLDCSPKRVIAAFQKYSLEAGVAFVHDFNRVIDELARQYPRCRGGIYASRLNYSDVIQISEETLATLRATSTILDDVQRRYDLLEALQGELIHDLQSDEINEIWAAIKASYTDSKEGIGGENTGWWKKMVGTSIGAISWATAFLAAPQAQFQGQLARGHRVKVFIATSILLRHGWAEWSRTNEDVVVPNLRVMFALKCDYVANRILSITDVISTNGYSLTELPMKIESTLTKKD